MADAIKNGSKAVIGSKHVRIAVTIVCSLLLVYLAFEGVKNLVWDNRDVIGYAIMNPSNVRKLQVILDSKTQSAVNDTFSSFPQSVK